MRTRGPVSDERRLALVTGANRGIGREVVRQLIEHGFRTILSARDQGQGRAAADALGAEFVQLDVADGTSVDRCFRTVQERHGRLDVLINNAAIDYDTWQRGVEADLVVVHQAFETNLFGAWRCCLRAVPLMRRNAWGRIVNVSSEGGSLASMGGGTPAYSTSKAALNALTRVLAAELRGTGILVNAVCPGWIATEMGGPGGRPVEVGAARILWAVLLADARMLAGGERSFDEAATRELVRRDVERARDIAASENHGAIAEGEVSRKPLSWIAVPALVIHGTADPVFPLEHGQALAGEIPAARLLTLRGAGHGVDRADWETIVRAIVEHTAPTDGAME